MLSPEFFKTFEQICEWNHRICSMEPRSIECLTCGECIFRTAFNGNPLLEHATPDGERHGPYPRTHCASEPGHACPTSGCDRHAWPNIDQLLTHADKEFLHAFGIRISDRRTSKNCIGNAVDTTGQEG